MLSLPRLLIVFSSFLDFIKVVFSFYFKNSSSQKTHIFFQIQSKKIRKKKKKKTSLTTERSAKIRARMLTRQKAMRERRDLAPSAAAFGSSFNLRDEDEDDAEDQACRLATCIDVAFHRIILRAQNSALFVVLGKGMTSRTFAMPVA